ncbi:MAG: hypothetical protein V4753_05695 [Pseudomonadota bacterium]
MTNQIALYLGLLILAALGLDFLLNEGAAVSFLARKFLNLVEWVVFWN